MSKSTAPMAKTPFSPGFRSRKALNPKGFTLVELLTVIAIIAILAAIIFPVFATVRENARRGNCMSNMQRLYQATRQFELDNRRYPDFLFGPALDNTGQVTTNPANAITMDDVKTLLNSTVTSNTPASQAAAIRAAQTNYKNSLYPEYINDVSVYKCPNNNRTDKTATNNIDIAERLDKDPTTQQSVKNTWSFYQYDSYDANPSIVGGKQDTTKITVRYARDRYVLLNRQDLDNLADSDPKAYAHYKDQLVFSNPSTDSVLTMCTYHATGYSKVILLWLNGQAKVLDVKTLDKVVPSGTQAYYHDYDFFKLTPTGGS